MFDWEYVVHTPVFDGPMELLLYLIRKQGVDIRQIPIALVTNEFLEYVRVMDVVDVDRAGTFLSMAALLCEIKAKALLFEPSETEAREDPREELIRRLLEYEQYREVSLELETREWLDRDVFAREPMEPLRGDPIIGASPLDLLELLQELILNKPELITHEIQLEHESLEDRARWLLERLEQGDPASLQALMKSAETRPAKILVFLVILELARLRQLIWEQDSPLGEVQVTLTADPSDVHLNALYDEIPHVPT